MKNLYFLIAIVLTNTIANSQITFQITYGGSGEDHAFEVKKTEDGYAIGGFTNSFGSGGNDFYLVKTDDKGDVLWSKTYGSTGSDECYGMLQATDGGFVMAGYTTSFGSTGTDVLIIKTNAQGVLQWSKMVSGFSSDFVITVTGDSGYVVVGTTYSFGSGNSDMLLCKLDTGGNFLWSKTIGGSGDEWGFNCRETNDGGVIATGITNSFGAGNYDFYVVKVDGNGTVQWTKTYGGVNRDDGQHAEQTSDGGYIITGYTQSFGAGGTDFLLIKTDANGNLQWNKTYGGTNNDYAISVKPAFNGGYAISGYTESFGFGNSDVYLVKTDYLGNIEWTRTFGGAGNEYSNKLSTINDDSYALASRTQSFGAGGTDFYLIKTDSLGNSGCNATVSTSLNIQTPVITVSSGGVAIMASPSVFSPSPTETSPNTIKTKLCSFCNENSTAQAIVDNPFHCNDVFISEYVEGTAKNRAIELTNTAIGCRNLNNYTIKIYQNASAGNFTVAPLSGILLPNESFSCCHDQASTAIKGKSKMICNCIDFDGNDAVGLYKNDTLIDMIGQIGNTPGLNGWQVGTGFTKDNTLVRKWDVKNGSPYWNIAQMEYSVLPVDNSDSLGKHVGFCTAAKSTIRFANSQTNTSEGQTIFVEIQVSSTVSGLANVQICRRPIKDCIDPPDEAICGTDFVITSTTLNSGCPNLSGSCFNQPISDGFSGSLYLQFDIYTDPQNDDDKQEALCYFMLDDIGNIKVDGDKYKHLILIDNVTPVSVSNLSKNSQYVKIFPVPASNNLDIINAQNAEIIIYNVLGEKIFSQQISNPTERIDISYLTNGVYLLKVNQNDVVDIYKIIKQ